MQLINALSLAPDVNDWLANSRHPRILHVFEQACNLINERREVLSVVTRRIGNGPFNLVVDDHVPFSDHLNVESLISIHGNEIILGDLTISTVDAELWNPWPDWKKLHVKREHILDQLTQLPITTYKRCGLDMFLAKNARNYSTTVVNSELSVLHDQSFNSLVSSLPIASLKSDIAGAKEITSKLAGLGSGLTPAGDDFILGAIYAAWIIHPPETAQILVEEIANTAAPLTTSLSAAWLRSAGRGEAGNLWHQFFDALVAAGRIAHPTYSMAVQEAVDKILAVGETSGADALAGFIRMFMSWAGLGLNLWEYNQP